MPDDDTSDTAAAKVRRPTEPELALIRRMAGAGVVSRTDSPRLLAEVDALRAERDARLNAAHGIAQGLVSENERLTADLRRAEAGAAAAREAFATHERQLSLAFAAFGRGGKDDIVIYVAKLLSRLAAAEELCAYAQDHVDGMKPDNVSPRLAELLAAWRAVKEGGGSV